MRWVRRAIRTPHIELDIGDVHQQVVPKADGLMHRIEKTIVQALSRTPLEEWKSDATIHR
jgi:hypothetical protein